MQTLRLPLVFPFSLCNNFGERRMRRFVGIFLILTLWLGPVAAFSPAGAESRLPACCRRHGAHHCMMAVERMAFTPGSTPAVRAPLHCPCYPSAYTAVTASAGVLASSTFRMAVRFAAMPVPSLGRRAMHAAVGSCRFDRGPPAARIG